MDSSEHIFLLLKQRKYLDITGAASMTISQEFLFDGETYRDDINAGYLGNAHGTVAAQASSSAAQTLAVPTVTQATTNSQTISENVITSNFPVAAVIHANSGGSPESSIILGGGQGDGAPAYPVPILDGAQTSYVPALVADSMFDQSDVYTHTMPRFSWSLRSAMKFWDTAGAVEGFAMTVGGLVTSGSYEITNFPATLVKLGQGLTGTGIPAGSVVAGYKDLKTIYMSGAGSATGAVAITVAAGTVTNADLVGWAWADEVVGWSSSKPVQL